MKHFIVKNKYILFPISMDAECHAVEIWNTKEKLYEFEIPIAVCDGAYCFQYYAPLSLEVWKGQEFTIKGDCPRNFLDAIRFSEDIPKTEQYKPSIHFAPETGWINDPNGMVYADGKYHLYFQHNPFQNQWGNLSWGHAVSTDLLTWKQVDTVMFPDEDGSIFSGSGIINEKALLGLPESALIFFYTLAGGKTRWSRGKKFRQKIAYSVDGGKTVQKRPGIILDHIVEENRDPKVYWHESSHAYYMVLFLEGNRFGIYRSNDLENWECTQTIDLDKAWECPDLREIPIEGGGTKWMFWSADGFYFLGDFDGYQFLTDGVRKDAYQTTIPYAAQTFWGTDDVITIPWLRTKNVGKCYRGVMGLPRKLTLAKTNEGLRLRMMPVESYLNARKLVYSENTCDFRYEGKTNAATEIQVLGAGAISFTAKIAGNTFVFDSGNGVLTVNGQDAFMGWNVHEMSILIDAEICEITTENGLYFGVFELDTSNQADTWQMKSREMLSVKILKILKS